ncbi:lysozyme inhibitor LprI family protein [Sphingomonas sp. Leaf412]|uniref:lysozyme inhibitor LprI family protein n=1 Tax=Sphingomonas sp. Leaf412 TaxID=1736370 RepID=UPI0009E883D2
MKCRGSRNCGGSLAGPRAMRSGNRDGGNRQPDTRRVARDRYLPTQALCPLTPKTRHSSPRQGRPKAATYFRQHGTVNMPIVAVIALQVTLSGLPRDTTEGCNDKDGTVTPSSCYSEHADAWQKRLNAAYPLTLEFVDGPQRKALQRAQSAWLKYRDATCDFYNLAPGSAHYIQGAYCMLDLTRSRALELEQYILP